MTTRDRHPAIAAHVSTALAAVQAKASLRTAPSVPGAAPHVSAAVQAKISSRPAPAAHVAAALNAVQAKLPGRPTLPGLHLAQPAPPRAALAPARHVERPRPAPPAPPKSRLPVPAPALLQRKALPGAGARPRASVVQCDGEDEQLLADLRAREPGLLDPRAQLRVTSDYARDLPAGTPIHGTPYGVTTGGGDQPVTVFIHRDWIRTWRESGRIGNLVTVIRHEGAHAGQRLYARRPLTVDEREFPAYYRELEATYNALVHNDRDFLYPTYAQMEEAYNHANQHFFAMPLETRGRFRAQAIRLDTMWELIKARLSVLVDTRREVASFREILRDLRDLKQEVVARGAVPANWESRQAPYNLKITSAQRLIPALNPQDRRDLAAEILEFEGLEEQIRSLGWGLIPDAWKPARREASAAAAAPAAAAAAAAAPSRAIFLPPPPSPAASRRVRRPPASSNSAAASATATAVAVSSSPAAATSTAVTPAPSPAGGEDWAHFE